MEWYVDAHEVCESVFVGGCGSGHREVAAIETQCLTYPLKEQHLGNVPSEGHCRLTALREGVGWREIDKCMSRY